MTIFEAQYQLGEFLKLPSETEWLEFKTNNAKPAEIGEYISAISNSACLLDLPHGYIVWGISDDMKVIGTDFRPKQAKANGEELENWLLRQLNPTIDFQFVEFTYDNKPIVLMEIQAAPAQPVYFAGAAYIRSGTYKKPLAKFPEKERKIWGKRKQRTIEEEIVTDKLSERQVFEYLDTAAYFTLLDQPTPTDRYKILERFEKDKLITRAGTVYSITYMGALLFARNLDVFEALSRKAVRVIQYKSSNKLEANPEQVGKKGYAVGFVGLIAYINSLLPHNEVIQEALRKEVSMYPAIAVRELVANAMIHQDLTITGTSPLVEIYPDRIEITNAGSPLIDPLRFIDEHPVSRNEKLARIMRSLGICEERGSGIDKVIYSVELYGLPAPKFSNTDRSTKAILYAPKNEGEMMREDKIRACYQHCVLKYVSNEQMTNQSLRERFKIAQGNYSIASRIIKDTIDANLIKVVDPTTSNKYKAYIPIWA